MARRLSLSCRMFQKEPLKRCVLHQCNGVCCSYGVWIDLFEKQKILEYSQTVEACMDAGVGGYENWFEDKQEEDPYTESGKVVHSKLIKRNIPFSRMTCIFQRKDSRCALQVASERIKEHPWYLKPFYCVLHPMDINQDGEIRLDETKLLLEESKSCLRFSDQFFAPIEIFEEELRYLLGNEEYQAYLKQAMIWVSKANKEIK